MVRFHDVNSVFLFLLLFCYVCVCVCVVLLLFFGGCVRAGVRARCVRVCVCVCVRWKKQQKESLSGSVLTN